MDYLKEYYIRLRVFIFDTRTKLEFYLGTIFDMPPKYKRREKLDAYMERLTPKQALRLSKFRCYEYGMLLGQFDFINQKAEEEPKNYRKINKHLYDLAKEETIIWDNYWRQALRRQFEEKHNTN